MHILRSTAHKEAAINRSSPNMATHTPSMSLERSQDLIRLMTDGLVNIVDTSGDFLLRRECAFHGDELKLTGAHSRGRLHHRYERLGRLGMDARDRSHRLVSRRSQALRPSINADRDSHSTPPSPPPPPPTPTACPPCSSGFARNTPAQTAKARRRTSTPCPRSMGSRERLRMGCCRRGRRRCGVLGWMSGPSG